MSDMGTLKKNGVVYGYVSRVAFIQMRDTRIKMNGGEIKNRHSYISNGITYDFEEDPVQETILS